MPLLDLWRNSRTTVSNFTIEQMVTMAGDGSLRDESECSAELRQVLSELPSVKLFEHVRTCLDRGFNKSGYVLQDLVNELGRRLDYRVENGLYQGKVNKVGFDGLWVDDGNHATVVEVKTTDAYRINLDVIAEYRFDLVRANRISEQSSILIVVGRTDTGDIEAQVRGSKHAWDIRLISIDALCKLVELKEAAGENETISKIQSLLIPFEYTRLDNIIDVVFVTAKDVESGSEDADAQNDDTEVGELRQEHTPPSVMKALRDKIVAIMATKLDVNLIAKSRAVYWSADKSIRIVCSLSKVYERPGAYYWYGFHPHWLAFLKEGTQSYHVLGCIGRNEAYAIPTAELEKLLGKMNITDRGGGHFYYHIILEPTTSGGMNCVLRSGERIDISQYVLQLEKL